MFTATCSVCSGPIAWQEIHVGDAVKGADGELAHLSCISGYEPSLLPGVIDDDFSGLGSNVSEGSRISD